MRLSRSCLAGDVAGGGTFKDDLLLISTLEIIFMFCATENNFVKVLIPVKRVLNRVQDL